MSSESPRALEVFAADQCTPIGDHDEYTVTVGAHPDFLRDGVSPSQAGDVLSVQEDGTLQTRVAGTIGPFERATVDQGRLVYRPKGPFGRCFIAGHVASWPNP
jgi:hypothetical protein